ncbi:MAG: SMP-30/gluconolactonase/LRE family protein [Armatimonadota bacterium]
MRSPTARVALQVMACLLWSVALAGAQAVQTVNVTILVDLDPSRADRTPIVDSIAADREGRLYLTGRDSGNILRVDPRSPTPVVVGRVTVRQVAGRTVTPDLQGIAVSQEGDVFVVSAPFREVLRIRRSDLDAQRPGAAETFATGVEGANGIAIDREGNVYVSGAGTGRVYRVGRGGGTTEVVVQIDPFVRTLPEGARQPIVANGLAFDAKGVLYIADTARGAVWKAEVRPGSGARPALVVQHPLLYGADGLAFDRAGVLWVTANERNAIVTVSPAGQVQQVFRNRSQGPLEFPSSLVFVGSTIYICNNDTPRGANLATNGSGTSMDGIGASIAQASVGVQGLPVP